MQANRNYQDLLERYEGTREYEAERVLLEIGEQLVCGLQVEGLSQAGFARRLGVSPAYVSRVLNGNPNMSINTLVRVADGLNMRVDVVLEPKHYTDFRREIAWLEKKEPEKAPVRVDAGALAA
jgi:plasmid maintenance system antidote protein VapI